MSDWLGKALPLAQFRRLVLETSEGAAVGASGSRGGGALRSGYTHPVRSQISV